MPKILKSRRDSMVRELKSRFAILLGTLEGEESHDADDATISDVMLVTAGAKADIRLAVADRESALKEVKRIK
jgi:hypothetical protein